MSFLSAIYQSLQRRSPVTQATITTRAADDHWSLIGRSLASDRSVGGR
jgi:hypothetical protein